MSISKRGNVAKGEMSIRVYLLPELKDKFKTACFLNGLNMSDVTAALIEEWLTKNAVDLPAPQRISKALTETGSADPQPATEPEPTEPEPTAAKPATAATAKRGKASKGAS
ncbi:hypothetical protein QUA56_30240 [Microcoleus sp. N3A4]|uniref:hypothetical protein n=1 Tax=unclassified Microcoleus TaxID=2642155 RepID=UPI002FCF8DB9